CEFCLNLLEYITLRFAFRYGWTRRDRDQLREITIVAESVVSLRQGTPVVPFTDSELKLMRQLGIAIFRDKLILNAQPPIEVLGFLWTVQLLIFKGKDGRSDGPNTAQEDQVTTLLL